MGLTWTVPAPATGGADTVSLSSNSRNWLICGGPELLKLSLEGLSASVQQFETSHPRLVETVNAISLMLSNSGL